MRKKLAMVLALVGVMTLAACSTSAPREPSELEPDKLVYKSCASCHGGNLEGRGSAPALNTIGAKLSEQEIYEAIVNGVGNTMPPAILQGEDAKAVAKWLAEQK